MTDSAIVPDVRLVVASGPGLVGRSGNVILVVPRISTATAAGADRLVATCLGTDHASGRTLLRTIAVMIGDDDSDELPGFCLLVGQDRQQTTLFVHGAVDVTLPTSGERVSAAGRLTWLELPLTSLGGFAATASGADEPEAGHAALDLRSGVVPGGAVRLDTRNADHRPASDAVDHDSARQPTATQENVSKIPETPAAAREPRSIDAGMTPPRDSREVPTAVRASLPAVDDPAPTFDAVLLTPDPVASLADPLPLAGELDAADEDVVVEGIACSRGHFNDPGAVYCGACGISMLQGTREFVSAPRPPLGVLIFDDGAAFSVDGDYVLGRDPELDPSVIAGQARALVLEDVDGAVSRVHAGLHLDGWSVLLDDRGSSNGTFFAINPETDWIRLRPGRTQQLLPGHRIRLGRRTAVFESHVRR